MKKEAGALMLVPAVASATVAAVWWWYRRRELVPQTWVEVGRVEELFVYPLKSGAPIVCKSFKCTLAGPLVGDSRDRVVAIVLDKDGSLVTGRDFPQITQISAVIADGVLTLSEKNSPSVTVTLKDLPEGNRQGIKIWRSNTSGVDCGQEVSDWLSAYLPVKVRLLYFPDLAGKNPEPNMLALPFIRPADGGLFSDAMSFNVLSKASLAHLNGRLASPVTSLNFRPNIVIDGDKLLPFEEDSWDWVRIGDLVFRGLAPCTRCLFTTVNPENGEKSASFEPLKTLRSYRILRAPSQRKLFGLSPVMGRYFGLRSKETSLTVGEAVYVAVS